MKVLVECVRCGRRRFISYKWFIEYGKRTRCLDIQKCPTCLMQKKRETRCLKVR